MCAARMDLLKCRELAYSEVRAAREAECRLYSETKPFSSSFFQRAKESCIKNKATRATQALFPQEGAGCVVEAFAAALADLSPQISSPQVNADKLRTAREEAAGIVNETSRGRPTATSGGAVGASL